MLKIIEKTPEKLVLEKVPVVFYILCGILFVSGIACGVIVSSEAGAWGYLLAALGMCGTFLLIVCQGSTTLVWMNKKTRVLHYGKRGLFTVRSSRYSFNEIAGITCSEQTDLGLGRLTNGKCGIIMENASGRKLLLYVNNTRLAHQTSELLNR